MSLNWFWSVMYLSLRDQVTYYYCYHHYYYFKHEYLICINSLYESHFTFFQTIENPICFWNFNKRFDHLAWNPIQLFSHLYHKNNSTQKQVLKHVYSLVFHSCSSKEIKLNNENWKIILTSINNLSNITKVTGYSTISLYMLADERNLKQIIWPQQRSN